MIIHLEVCDVCKTINRGADPVVPFKSTGLEWDVCPGCLKDRKFCVVSGTRERKQHLLPRIEALVLSELRLMRSPV